MQIKPFALFQCWKTERIGQVINKEAASVDTATFLATHVPLNKLAYHRSPQVVSDTSESGLLQELRLCAEQDRHAFVIVQGIPGTGKSHLIRWLKECYVTETDVEQDRVLFVERAQCSLRGTLEQIIRSGIFDERTMKEQLDKLNSARIELSKETLAETLLDQVRLAAYEMQQIEMPRWLARRDRWQKFLLDIIVRQELLKARGPIDRIVRFLSSNIGINSHEMPTFEESDFDFKAGIRRQIEGYQDAKCVADELQGEDGLAKRRELVSYMNKLLPFAIGHATALTSDDFKQIFYDLRRHLRQQNQMLTLFIEDITALTGIDVGLLDVLATQHLGEGNQEFCRITSVIGITDNYFMDHFPDNMKDRVTHRLTLNATQSRLTDAELLTDAEAAADLAARYLNAMRLEREELDEWFRQGGKPALLPNACTNCVYKSACHAAFGTQKIQSANGAEQDIGLYPFNQKAIWTLYQHIDTSSSKRTPRSLLHNVLLYVMQSHGSKVEQGSFPPPSSELGSEFTTFSLAEPLQRSLITFQGGNDAKRIETLMMIWGDGTINAKWDGKSTLIGGLPQEVFQAFGIKLITGEKIAPSSPDTLSSEIKTGSLPLDRQISPRGENEILLPSDPSKVELQNRYVKDITEWVNGGKLVYYNEYREMLVSLLRSFIDWDFYRISDRQLDEALRGKRIQIERQEGKMNVAHYLTLKCDAEFVAVLLGLISIKEHGQDLKDAVLSGCLSNFSIWLHMHEAEIVQFVLQPHRSVSNQLPLDEMLFFNCLIMACLQGALKSSYSSAQSLWLDLVSFCVNTRNSSTQWEQLQQKVGQLHSRAWAGLVKQITPKRAAEACSLFLSVLNCAQGGSSDVRFLDAPAALCLIKRLRSNDWCLPEPTALDSAAVIPWGEVVAVYTIIRNQFAAVLDEDRALIQSLLTRLNAFTEDRPAKEVFQAIQNFVEVMGEAQRTTSFKTKRSLSATQLTNMSTHLRNLLKVQKREQLALLLSAMGETLHVQAQEYIAYFDDFVKEATKLKEANRRRLAQLQGQVTSESLSKHGEVRSLYEEIHNTLDVHQVKEEKV